MAWTKIILAGDAVTDLTGTAYRTLFTNVSGAVTELAHGTNGQVLTSGGASANPTWEDAQAGTHALGAGQTDVVITAVANDEVLAYDSGGNWINQTAAEAGLAAASHGTHLTANSVGNSEIDNSATDIALAQVILTPTTTGTGTTVGTLFYDSDDDHLYVYTT